MVEKTRTEVRRARRRRGRAWSAVAISGPFALMAGLIALPAPAAHAVSADTGASPPAPGFIFAHGRFTPVPAPRGLRDEAPQGIGTMDLNDRGQIVGTYGAVGGTARGVLLDRGLPGGFRRIDVPGAKGTQPQAIDDHGRVVGKYSDVSGDVSSGAPVRGFLLRAGRYVRLDYPGSQSSQAFDINAKGQVVGEYQDAAGAYHGYLWQHGRFRTIDAPGSGGTSATGINDAGQITGVAGTTPAGFVRDHGRFTIFTVPGAALTFAYGINNRGDVVGLSAPTPDATTASAFRRDRHGRVTTFTRPGNAITAAFDINDHAQIIGVATNTPAPTALQPAARR